MFHNALIGRIKKLEKKIKVNGHTFHFWDGTQYEVTAKQYQKAWSDIISNKPNAIYNHLKMKLREGFPDDLGIVHLMQAYDPLENADLWEEN
jgi:hypothetical protein